MDLSLLLHLLVFIVSLTVLSYGADIFVEASGRLAKVFGLSDLIIGLTIISIGTSIPELASSVSAALNNAPDIISGNIIGSNIANIGLILGISALFKTIRTDASMLDGDGYIMTASTLLFFVLIFNNELSQIEGALLIILYFLYLFFIVRSSLKQRDYHFKDFMLFVFGFQYIPPVVRGVKRGFNKISKTVPQELVKEARFTRDEKIEILKDIFLIVLGCSMVIGGAKYLIEEALWIAEQFEVPQNVIGLTMIAVGTSLPELIVSIAATRRNRGGIVVGNVMGSNIANILLIGGVSGAIFPLSIPEVNVIQMTPILISFTVFLLFVARTNWRISRIKGFALLVWYVAFVASTL